MGMTIQDNLWVTRTTSRPRSQTTFPSNFVQELYCNCQLSISRPSGARLTLGVIEHQHIRIIPPSSIILHWCLFYHTS